MNRTKTTNTIIRSAVFALIFLAVLSVSFLVEARDLPAGVSNAVPAPAQEFMCEIDLDTVADGIASWYGREFHGRRTASGRTFNMNELTAAHRSLPFGTLLRVVNKQTGDVVIVEVTDRGPFIRKRVVDLSYAAAKQLGISVTPVGVEALTPKSIEAYYVQNDTTVLAITHNQQVVSVDSDSLEAEPSTMSLTSAMRNLTSDEFVIVSTSEKGAPQFRRAKRN